MEVKAKLNYLRISPRKVRLVADLVKNKNVDQAIDQLKFLPKISSSDVAKLINSAAANAVNNFQLQRDNLYIKNVIVEAGPTLHRFTPKAFGRANSIRKRSSNVTVILAEKLASVKKTKAAKAGAKEQAKLVSLEEVKESRSIAKGKDTNKTGKAVAGVKRKNFSRKTG